MLLLFSGTDLDPALIGLSVAYIFSLTDAFSFSVRTSTDIENYVRETITLQLIVIIGNKFYYNLFSSLLSVYSDGFC